MRSILFVALLVPALAAAQETLEPGARIRLLKTRQNVYEPRQTGIVLSATGDSATIRLDPDLASTQVFALSRLEVARGQRSLAREGAGIGAAAGLVVGFVLGYAGGEDCNQGDFICFDRSDTGAMGAFAGLCLGVVSGAVIGQFKKTDRWVRILPGR